MSVDIKTIRRFDRSIDSDRVRIKDADDKKTVDEVFDKRTLSILNKLMMEGVIKSLDFPVSTGKEAKVFKGVGKDGRDVAVKIYRVSNATFKNISRYLIGDPRFAGLERNKSKLIYTWATKEYKNLARLHKSGLSVPEPLGKRENVVVMEFIGDEGGAAPTLKRVGTDDPEGLFDEVRAYLRIQHQEARLVHGDFSEYNILMKGSKPYVIDVGQAVTTDHPMAREWLQRDVSNTCRYFRSLGVEADEKALFEEIVSRKGGE